MSKRTEPEDGRENPSVEDSDAQHDAKFRKMEGATEEAASSSWIPQETSNPPAEQESALNMESRNNQQVKDEANSSNNNGGGAPEEGEKYNKQKHAMEFLLKVRQHYASNPTVYNEFLEIMKDFKSANIDTPDVIVRVKELFKGHNNLIQEFNSFLPPGYKIEVDVEPPPQQQAQASSQADLEHARNYVRKIKTRFSMQPQIYKQFLEILHSYYQGQHQINEVLEEVGELFQTHHDLLEEFKLFLPRAVTSAGIVIPPKAKVKPKQKVAAKEEKVQKQERKRDELIGKRELPPREKRPVFEEDRFRRPVAKEEVSTKKLPPKQPFNNPAPQYGYFTEFNFFAAVKRRISPLLFHEFLQCIDLHSQDIITQTEMINLVKDLIGNHNDLLDAFKKFIGVYSGSDAKEEPIKPQAVDLEFDQEFQEEDEKYELDLMIDMNRSTMKFLEDMMEVAEQTNEAPKVETLEVMHLRNIERIYGERSNDIIEALFLNPVGTVPVIQKRLRQKNGEWTNAKKNMQKAFVQAQQQSQPQQPQPTNS